MAASNLNRVVLTGNLTADPDLRSLPSGTSKLGKLRVASNMVAARTAPAASTSTSRTTST